MTSSFRWAPFDIENRRTEESVRIDFMVWRDFTEIAVPPGQAGSEYRIWVEWTNPPPVIVRERFVYPEKAEQGAILFREFSVFKTEDGSPASGVVAGLTPAGSCQTPEPGRLSCDIPSDGLALGVHEFSFETAVVNGELASVTGWPRFDVELVERPVKMRVEFSGDATIKAAIGATLSATGKGGLALELLETGDFIVEASTSRAFGVGLSGGFGGSVEFGPIEPRAGVRGAVGGDLRIYEKAAIQLRDLNDPAQLRALAAFLLVSAPRQTSNPIIDTALDYALDFFLGDSFQFYLVRSENGAAITGRLSGYLGLFTQQRSTFDPFAYGLGAEGAVSASVGLEVDELTGDTHVIFRGVPEVGGVFDLPTLQAIFETFFEEEDFLPEVAGRAIGGVVARLTFQGGLGPSSLTKLTFQLQPTIVVNQKITTVTVTAAFEGDNLRQAFRTVAPTLFTQPTLNPFTIAQTVATLTRAISQLEGTVTATELHGVGIASAFGLGLELNVGVTIRGAIELGAAARLTSSMKTHEWMIRQGRLVPVSLQPFEDPLADERRMLDAVGLALQLALDSFEAEVGSVAFDAALTAATLVGRFTEATIEAYEATATFLDAAGEALGSTIEATAHVAGSTTLGRLWSLILSDLRQAQASLDPFPVSEFVQIDPVGVSVDPPLPMTIGYLDAFVGDPQQLRIYRRNDDKSWSALLSTVDADAHTVSTAISRFGVFVVGFDNTPPVITLSSQAEEIRAVLTDAGSGVDPASVALLADGVAIAASFDPVLGIVVSTEPVAAGAVVEIVAADGAGNESRLAVTTVTTERVAPLVEGWNLVGWTGNDAGIDVVDPIADDLAVLFTWDAGRQAFDRFSPTAPAVINSADGLQAGTGAWLRIGDSQGLDWIQPDRLDLGPIALQSGFNLVVWRGANNTPVAEAVAELCGALQSLFLWDAAQQRFLSYSPAQPAFLNSATTLTHGDGVWLNMSGGASWTAAGP